MTTKRAGTQIASPTGLAVPVEPLGQADLALMRRAMSEIAPGWSVDLQGICADEATLVLLPEGGDDSRGPSFLISRETYGFRVDQVHWETLSEVGVFASMGEVVGAIWMCLSFRGDGTTAMSLTIH